MKILDSFRYSGDEGAGGEVAARENVNLQVLLKTIAKVRIEVTSFGPPYLFIKEVTESISCLKVLLIEKPQPNATEFMGRVESVEFGKSKVIHNGDMVKVST